MSEIIFGTDLFFERNKKTACRIRGNRKQLTGNKALKFWSLFACILFPKNFPEIGGRRYV